MAMTQVYTCDICKSSKSKDDLANIEVRSSGIHIKGNPYCALSIDVCKDCLKKKGFVVESNSKEELEDAANQNSVTLKDKLYDILEDMGVVFEE